MKNSTGFINETKRIFDFTFKAASKNNRLFVEWLQLRSGK
jgi:hypothetical protein